jgi:DNA-binding NarL/FixJ family response regulator
MIHILLVEDQPALQKGLKMRLNAEADLSIVGEAADMDTTLDFAEKFHPDVIVIDVDIEQVDGMELAGAVHEINPRTPLVLLSNHDDPWIQYRAACLGAAGFVVKSLPVDDLVTKIRQVFYVSSSSFVEHLIGE